MTYNQEKNCSIKANLRMTQKLQLAHTQLTMTVTMVKNLQKTFLQLKNALLENFKNH